MRNPFRRRRKLPGAEAEWDESKHVSLGEDFVVIPEDQLNSEGVERLTDVALYPSDDGQGVFVNVDAAEAEVEERAEELSDELAERAIARLGEGDLADPEYRAQLEAAVDADMQSAEYEARMQEFTKAAFNNKDHWAVGGVDDMDGDARYSLMKVNLVTGRIGD